MIDRCRMDRRHFLALAAGVVGSPLSSLAQTVPLRAGEVEQLTGEATAAKAGESRKLAIQLPVHIEELIRTGVNSRLALRLGAKTVLRLGASTEVRIDRYIVEAGGDIAINDGTVMFDRIGRPLANPLNFRNPYGLIAIRGTRFYAGPSRGAFGILVEHGRVEVTAGGRTVIVPPGLGTDISAPGQAPSRPARWAAARMRDIRAAIA